MENCRLPLMDVRNMFELFLRSIVLPLGFRRRAVIVVDFRQLFFVLHGEAEEVTRKLRNKWFCRSLTYNRMDGEK
jgi:hypothetical protein